MTRIGLGRHINTAFKAASGTRRAFCGFRRAPSDRMVEAARQRTFGGARALGAALKAKGFRLDDPTLAIRSR
ncbi:MAG: hypothetical protein JWM27_1223 [Gemmatimonadetes bacterium]|nr:hypothetical protein [Gemmatimonadota bacterium]